MIISTSVTLSDSCRIIAERNYQQLIVINVSRGLNGPFAAEAGAMLDHRMPRNDDALHDEAHNAVRGAFLHPIQTDSSIMSFRSMEDIS